MISAIIRLTLVDLETLAEVHYFHYFHVFFLSLYILRDNFYQGI